MIFKTTELINFGNAIRSTSTDLDVLAKMTSNMSYEQTMAVLSTKMLSEEDKNLILMENGLITAETQKAVATNASNVSLAAYTAGIKANTKAWLANIATNPITWIAAIAAAIYGIVKAIDYYNSALERQKEKLEDVKQAFEDAQTEVKSANSELETAKNRIKELQGMGNLSFVEAAELEKLKQTVNELSIAADIAEKIANSKAVELSTENQKTYNEEYGIYNSTNTSDNVRRVLNEAHNLGDDGARYISEQLDNNNLSVMIAALLFTKEQFNQAQKDYEDAVINGNIESVDRLREVKEEYQTEINDIEGVLRSSAETLVEYQTNAIATGDTNSDYFKSIESNLKLIYEYLDSAKWNTIKFDDIFNYSNLEKTKEELIAMAKEGKLTPETISQYENLNKALAESNFILKENETAAQKFVEQIYSLVDASEDIPNEQSDLLSPTISSTIDQLNTQLKPAFDALKEAYLDIFTTDDDGKEVFTLENVDLSMLDEIKSAIDDLNSNEDLGINIDYSSFDNLANVLTDTKSTAKDVHNVINAFAGEIIQSLNPSLGETTEETYQFTQAMLKSLGVMNSEEVMAAALGYSLEELAELKRAASDAGYDLTDKTEEEISDFITEQIEAGNCSEALYLLALKKELLNRTAINTASDIEYILGLAQSAGVASNALSKLADAKAMLETATAKGDTRGIYEAKKYARELQGEIRNDIVSFEIPEIKFEPPSNSSSNSKSSGSSSEKDTTETFDWIEQAIENVEKETQSLDETVNSAYSTFSQKNKALAGEIGKVNDEINLQQKAYDEYMRKAESVGLSDQYKSLVQSGDINIEDIKDEKLQKQIDEYQKWYDKAQEANEAIKDLKTDMKDLYVSAYELQTENLKDRLDSDSITEKEYLEGLKQAYESFYADIEDFAQQYHEAVLEYLGEEKDYLNDVASAAAAILDREIDAIQDDADAQEDSIQKQIDLLEAKKKPLQDELDALEDKAKHEELIYNLQKAQADLAKAETQRTKLLYTKDKGMIYTADEIEIRNAQKDVDDAKLEIEKQNIQDQIDLIDDEISKYNDLIDQINKAADDQIDALERIKNKWQETIDLQEYTKNVSLFTNEFGTDAINKLLTGNDDDLLAQWKNNYVNTLAAIDMESQGYIGDMAQQMASLYDVDLSSLQAQFGNVKDSVGEVTDALGDTVNALAGGGKTTYKGNEGTSIISKGQPANSSSDTGDSLQSAIQNETKTAMDAFDQHTDKLTNEVIPAIQSATEEMNAFNEAADMDIEKTVTITYNVIGSPSLDSTANVEGTAHVEGTAKVSGDWGVQQGGKSLVGETGRELIVRKGKFFTVGDNGAEFIDLQKGDIIFNHTQTEKLLKDGKISSRGRALANGTMVEPDGTIHARSGDLIPINSPAFQKLDPKTLNIDPEQFQLYKKIGEISQSLDLGVMKVQGINQMMSDMVSKTVNNNVVTNNNNQPHISVGDINVTCPGVTSQEVVKEVGKALENQFSGLALKAYQQSKITR